MNKPLADTSLKTAEAHRLFEEQRKKVPKIMRSLQSSMKNMILEKVR